METQQNKKLTFIMAIAFVAIVLFIITLPKDRVVCIKSPNIITMNTVGKITAVAADEQTCKAAITAAIEKIRYFNDIFNRYDPNSEISMLNKKAFASPVKLSSDLFEIIEDSIYYSKITGGCFDITIAPLIDLFKTCNKNQTLPTAEQLEDIKKKIGYQKIILDANEQTVQFAVEGMKLDLGAIAKGFAIDKAVSIMKFYGTTGGVVDIGGDVGCFGITGNKNNNSWLIGIQDPAEKDEDKTIAELNLNDAAAATSGDYRRFYKIGDKNYSHIFNPLTEQSATALKSATVIATTATAADALATAVSVLGAEKGFELISSIENTDAIMLSSSGKLIKTNEK